MNLKELMDSLSNNYETLSSSNTTHSNNNMPIRELRKIVSRMSAAANKRLKRLEAAGIMYGYTEGDDTISGVRKFGVKGKTDDEVRNEFKRVSNYLRSPQSSLTGMHKAYKEFERKLYEKTGETFDKAYHRLTRREQKEYDKMLKQKESGGVSDPKGRLSKYEKLKRWRDTWDIYNRLVEEGYYAPTEYDSKQVREVVLAGVYYAHDYNLSESETWDRIVTELTGTYEDSVASDINNSDVSTSSLISMGSN